MGTEQRIVEPIGRVRGSVRVPGSKSLSNRALLLAALCKGSTAIEGILDAEDTRMMRGCLQSLGVHVDVQGPVWTVQGCGGRFPCRQADLFVGNSGTTVRPVTAAVAFSGGTYRIDGVERMRQRPIGDLVESLRALGASIGYLGEEGYPPIQVSAGAPHAASRTSVRGNVSSQFLTALLMAAPAMAGGDGLEIRVEGELISRPYIDMTVRVMESFGVQVEERGGNFFVARQSYRSPGTYHVEADASSASYFLALGAIAGGPVRVCGVGQDSLQGDAQFARVLARMGARTEFGRDYIEVGAPLSGRLHGIDFDASKIPDAAMTLAVVALFADSPTRLGGIGSWRVKETDRLEAMSRELARLGAAVTCGPDWIRIEPAAALHSACVQTYRDHRMAMSLSLAACAGIAVAIEDPGCVAKTFPDYFQVLDQLIKGSSE